MNGDKTLSGDTIKLAIKALKNMRQDWFRLAPNDSTNANATPITDWLNEIDSAIKELEELWTKEHPGLYRMEVQ